MIILPYKANIIICNFKPSQKAVNKKKKKSSERLVSWAEIANPRIKLLKKSAFQKFLTLLLREKEKLNTKASHRNKEGSTEEKIQSGQELVMKYRK